MEKPVKNISVNDWAEKRDRDNAETLKILAFAFIKENSIDWNSPSGRGKVISHINSVYYGEDRSNETYNPEWQKHQPDNSPFDLTESEIDNNTPYFDSPLQRVESFNAQFEVKEILREHYDKVYKSAILSNLNDHGRIKLIRKAKILMSLQKKE
jgi:hypothetical protein